MIRKLVACVVLPFIVTALFADEAQGPPSDGPRVLTFEDRVAAQRAIEEVYWRHRIWPKENRSRSRPSRP